MSGITLTECIYQILQIHGTKAFQNSKLFHSGLMDFSQGKLKDQKILSKIIDDQYLQIFAVDFSGIAALDRAVSRSNQFLCNNYPVTTEWASDVSDSFRDAIKRYKRFSEGTKKEKKTTAKKDSSSGHVFNTNKASASSESATSNLKPEPKKDTGTPGTDNRPSVQTEPKKNTSTSGTLAKVRPNTVPKKTAVVSSSKTAAKPDDKVAETKKKAGNGNSKAQYQLANWYLTGKNVEKDIRLGMGWLTKSANNGYAPAQKKMGKILSNGNEVVQADKEKAAEWLKKAADQNDATAQYELGRMLVFGKDEEEGLRLLLLADYAGNSKAHDLYQNLVQDRPKLDAAVRAAVGLRSSGLSSNQSSTRTVEVASMNAGVAKSGRSSKKGGVVYSILVLIAVFAVRSFITNHSSEPVQLHDTVPQTVTQTVKPKVEYSIRDCYRMPNPKEYYQKYVSLFYDEDTHALKEFYFDYLVDKASGITMEDLQGINSDEWCPGIDKMPFASLEILDKGNCYDVAVRFVRLDILSNARQMNENEVIVYKEADDAEDGGLFDADSTIQSIVDLGGVRVTDSEVMEKLSNTEVLRVRPYIY